MINPLATGGAPTPDEKLKQLFEKITPIVGSLSHLHTSLNNLRDNLGRMAELSSRANAALMLLVGLPRIFRSDLYHMTAYGASHGGGSGGPGPWPLNPMSHAAREKDSGAFSFSHGGERDWEGGKAGYAKNSQAAMMIAQLGVMTDTAKKLHEGFVQSMEEHVEKFLNKLKGAQEGSTSAEDSVASLAKDLDKQRGVKNKALSREFTEEVGEHESEDEFRKKWKKEQTRRKLLGDPDAMKKLQEAYGEVSHTVQDEINDLDKQIQEKGDKIADVIVEKGKLDINSPSYDKDKKRLETVQAKLDDDWQELADKRKGLFSLPPDMQLEEGIPEKERNKRAKRRKQLQGHMSWLSRQGPSPLHVDFGDVPSDPFVGPVKIPFDQTLKRVSDTYDFKNPSGTKGNIFNRRAKGTELPMDLGDYEGGLSKGLGDRIGKANKRRAYYNNLKMAWMAPGDASKPPGERAINPGNVLEALNNASRKASVYLQRLANTVGVTVGKTTFLGRTFLNLRDAIRDPKKFGKFFSQLGQSAAMPTLYAGAVAGSLLSAASPDTFNTLTGSVKLLAMALGTNLIPAAVFAAFHVQKLALWVRSINGPWTRFLGGLLGASIAIGWLLTVVGMAVGALGNLMPAVTAIVSVFKALGVAGTAASAGLALLAIALISAISTMKGKQEETGKKLDKYIGTEDLSGEASTDVKELLEGLAQTKDPERRLIFLERQKDKLEEEHEKKNKKLSTFMAETAKGSLGVKAGIAELMGDWPYVGDFFTRARGVVGLHGPIKPESEGEKTMLEYMEKGMTPEQAKSALTDEATRAKANFHLASKYLSSYQKDPNMDPARLTEENRAKKQNQMSTMLLALPSIKGTAQYSSIEEAHKRTQIAAAGEDPITQMMEKWHREDLAEMVKQTGLMESQDGLIKQLLGMLVK